MRRLTATAIAIALLMAYNYTYAQKVSINASNLPLAAVLDSVKQQTGFAVFAQKNIFENTTPVSVSIKDLPLNDALQLILQDRPLTFEISSKTIFISPDSSKPSSANKSFASFVNTGYYGHVTGNNGQPVEAASVTNLNTGKTVATGPTGFFRIIANHGDQIQITSVGYITQVNQINKSRHRLNIHLQVKESVLDEATVVAYGTTTRRETTGSISVIKAREFAGVPSPSFSNMLQGRATGLDVTNMSGAPGSGGTIITVRGYNSLDVEQGRTFSNPLWVVDDVPLPAFTSPVTGTNLLADINPDFIESIQVLKDASAAALYGSRASNGVIIVRTKKGRFNQKSEVHFNASQSFNAVSELPTITIGRAERDIRLKAFLNFPEAFVAPNPPMYTYPLTYRDVYLNPSGRIDYFFRQQATSENGIYLQDSLNPFFNNSSNFFPVYYRTGKITNANVQAYGGASNMNYGITSGFYNQQGIVSGSGFTRFDLNSTLHAKPGAAFSIEARMNGSLIDRTRSDRPPSIFGEASPIIEKVPLELFQLSSLLPGQGSAVWNDIQARLVERKESNRSLRFRSNLRLAYDISKLLSLSTSLAADYSAHRRNNFSPSTLNDDNFSSTQGEAAQNLLLLNESLLTYNNKFGNHSLHAVAGFSYQLDQEDYSGGEARNSPSDRIYYARPGFPLIGERIYFQDGTLYTQYFAFQKFLSDRTQKALLSYFTRWEYGYRKKYFATLSLRRDGSSVFGEDTRWGSFPSFAGSWIFSEEKKLSPHLPWLDFGKLRASWGRTGMQFSQNYLALGIMQAGRFPFQGRGVIVPDYNEGLYNENLTWEETTQFDVGVDAEMFKSRLSVSADYFVRFTKNMLMPVRLPGTFNGYLSQWRNAASISNRGIEVSVSYNVIRSAPLSWKLTLNGTHVWNRFERSFNNRNITPEHTTVNRRWDLGKPLNGIYGLQTTGLVGSQDELPIFYNGRGTAYYLAREPQWFYKPGDPRFVDQNGDGTIDRRDEVYLGSALPAISGGMYSHLAWKYFELDVLFTYQLRRHIINAVPVTSLRTNDSYYSHPLLIDLNSVTFWTKKGDVAHFSPIQYDSGSGVYDIAIDRYVERVNWLKLKSVVARFQVPQRVSRKLKLGQLQLFLSGENLLLLTNYSGIDPETVSVTTGIDNGQNYPLARHITAGINLKL